MEAVFAASQILHLGHVQSFGTLGTQLRHGIESGAAEDLPEGMALRLQTLAKRVCRVLYLTGYARIDLRLTESGQPYVIEANPNPILAPDEDFAQSAMKAGLSYPQLIDRIVRLGIKTERE